MAILLVPEVQAKELITSFATVAESVSELQDLFAVGAGLQSIIGKAVRYVSSWHFLAQFNHATGKHELVLGTRDGATGRVDILQVDRLKEQVCTPRPLDVHASRLCLLAPLVAVIGVLKAAVVYLP